MNQQDVQHRPSFPTHQEGVPADSDVAAEAANTAATPPHEAERQLRRSEERYRALVTATAQIVWVTTAEGLVQEELPSWLAYTGQSVEASQGWGWLEAIHPDDRERTARHWSHALANKGTSETEYRVRRADGVYRTVLSRAVPILDEAGNVRDWVGSCTDITERRQLEERLRQSEREATERAGELEAIFESIADTVIVYDSNGAILKMNRAGRALFSTVAEPGYEVSALPERVMQRFLRDEHGETFPLERFPTYRVLQGETLSGATSVDCNVYSRDNEEFRLNVSGAPIRDQRGQLLGGVMIYRDVTERRHLELRTREALQALLDMAEALVQGSADVSLAGRQTSGVASTVAHRLAELTRSVIGCQRISVSSIEPETGTLRPLAVLGMSPDNEQFWRTSRQDKHLSDLLPASISARLRAGEIVIIDMTEPPFKDRFSPYETTTMLAAPMRLGNDLVGLLLLDYANSQHGFSDEELALAGAVAKLGALVIERERLLREREEARASELALREASRRMDEFLGIASHELKTPLTNIKLSLQLAQRRTKSLTSQEATSLEELLARVGTLHDMFGRTERQAQRLGRLVDDLLDVSRIQAGRVQLRLEPADLATIVRDAVQEQRHLAPERSIQLQLPDGLRVPLVADAERIGQVVTNYLTNALKYSQQEQPVEVGLEVIGQRGRVWVRDHGPGIPAVEQPRIWERFYREPGIRGQSGSGVGLGLGLYISRTIIERHGGDVGVESAPGQGSTFWFTLPLAQAGE